MVPTIRFLATIQQNFFFFVSSPVDERERERAMRAWNHDEMKVDVPVDSD